MKKFYFHMAGNALLTLDLIIINHIVCRLQSDKAHSTIQGLSFGHLQKNHRRFNFHEK
jgi:hypothetical protein